jgi:hypothetical protein
MHLAYSALRSNIDGKKVRSAKTISRLKYEGYLTACEKYQSEIAAIQQYIPGWKPAFK